MTRSNCFEASIRNAHRWLFAALIGGLLPAISATAADPAPERIAWRKVPIAIPLTVGAERLVHFPDAVKVGIPPQLQSALRVQSIAGTLYLLARQPFDSTRVIVRGLGNEAVYVLDLSATTDGVGSTPIVIYRAEENENVSEGADAGSGMVDYGYVTLTRFAAQQLYAPARLLKTLPGVVRAPVRRGAVSLVRGAAVGAQPLIAWRAGDLHVTAVKLTNKTRQPVTLDPRTLRGRWLSATFQHNRLHPAGSEADRTVVYLISERPFADAL